MSCPLPYIARGSLCDVALPALGGDTDPTGYQRALRPVPDRSPVRNPPLVGRSGGFAQPVRLSRAARLPVSAGPPQRQESVSAAGRPRAPERGDRAAPPRPPTAPSPDPPWPARPAARRPPPARRPPGPTA